MNTTANEKILLQVMEAIASNSQLTSFEVMTFSLQLLGWAKMTSKGQLEGALKLEGKAYSEPDRVMKVWDQFAKRPDKLGYAAACSNWKIPSQISPSALSAAIDLCIRLAETGMLENFDPTDCIYQVGGREAGEYSLPPQLADLLVSLGRIQPKTAVYTPWSNGMQLAVRSARLGAAAYLEVQQPLLAALINLFIDEPIEVVQGDPIREPSAVEGGKLRQFETCLAFPPIGYRYTPDVVERDLYSRFKERTNSGVVLWIWHIMAQTRGRAVIAVPHTTLSSPGADRVVREELLRRGLIEAIVSMPSGLLPYANVPFALLVLNLQEPRQVIRFINAEVDLFREPVSKARAKLTNIDGIVARVTGELTDELVAEVTTEEVFANDTILQVNRYVLPEATRKTEKLLASAQTRQLGEIVSMVRPMPTTTNDGTVKAWEVGAADLPEFGYIAAPTKLVGIDPATAKKNKHQFLQPLDIVIIIKGSVGKVGIVPNDVPAHGEGGWVAGQSAVILRADDPRLTDPRALVMYLRSPLGKELLEAISVRTTIPLIQQRELQRLQVITPPNKDAIKIGAILDEQAKIQQEIEKLRARQAGLAKDIWTLG